MHLSRLYSAGLLILSLTASIPVQAQRKSVLEKRVTELDRLIQKLSNSQRRLKVRIAAMEQLSLKWSPDVFRQHYVRANKDAITNDIVNIAANAFGYRIRPETMGGRGGRTYEGYTIPDKMVNSENGSYTITLYKDSVIITGRSSNKLGLVRAKANDRGVTDNWMFTGEFE